MLYVHILKRNKRSSKSKTNNSSSSKHETSTGGSVTGSDVELTQKHSQLQQNKSNNNTNNNESSTVSVPIQKTENLNKVKETKVVAIASNKPPTENLNKTKETTKVLISSKPPSVEKPKVITAAPAPVADTPEEVLSKQNSNTKNTVQKDSSSLPTPEMKTFEKITAPVEVTPEPPANDVKKTVLAMGRLLEPRSSQPIGKSFGIKLVS